MRRFDQDSNFIVVKRMSKTGFSIMETVVSMAILCVIMVLAFGVIPSSIKAMNKASYYQFASSQAMRLIELASESSFPEELKISLKFPVYDSAKDIFLSNKINPKPLPFSYFGIEQLNPGIIVYTNDNRKINFVYLVTYHHVESEISLEYALTDILVDIWWSENMNDLNLGRADVNPDSLSHVSYIKRIYRRGFDVKTEN